MILNKLAITVLAPVGCPAIYQGGTGGLSLTSRTVRPASGPFTADRRSYSQLQISNSPLVRHPNTFALMVQPTLAHEDFELRSVARHRNASYGPPTFGSLQVADVHKMTRSPLARSLHL